MILFLEAKCLWNRSNDVDDVAAVAGVASVVAADVFFFDGGGGVGLYLLSVKTIGVSCHCRHMITDFGGLTYRLRTTRNLLR